MVRNGQKWAYFTCNLLQMLDPTGEHVLKKKIFGPTLFGGLARANKVFFCAKMDPKWTKMARNGQKWAYFTCNLLQMLDPTGEHVLKKKVFLAPPFLGAGGGPIRYFFWQKWIQNVKNGQRWASNVPRTAGNGRV